MRGNAKANVDHERVANHREPIRMREIRGNAPGGFPRISHFSHYPRFPPAVRDAVSMATETMPAETFPSITPNVIPPHFLRTISPHSRLLFWEMRGNNILARIPRNLGGCVLVH